MSKEDVMDVLYYRYFHVLFDKNLEKFHGDAVLAFAHAIVESSNAKIKNASALRVWARKYSKCRSIRKVNSDAA